MTEQEIASAEARRGSTSKSTMRLIMPIYDKYNGTTTKNCWCSGTVRKAYAKTFFTWFDEQTKSDKDE